MKVLESTKSYNHVSHAFAYLVQIFNFKFAWVVEFELYINYNEHLVAW